MWSTGDQFVFAWPAISVTQGSAASLQSLALEAPFALLLPSAATESADQFAIPDEIVLLISSALKGFAKLLARQILSAHPSKNA